MSVKPTFKGHPDEVFVSEKEVLSSTSPGSPEAIEANQKLYPPALLTEEVNALAASLGVDVTPKGKRPYDPDAFVQAIKANAIKLGEIRQKLSLQLADQAAREIALAAREEAVAFREERMAAYEKLQSGANVEEKKGWLGRLVYGDETFTHP